MSDEYFDTFLFESDPELLPRIVTRMVDLVPDGVDLLGDPSGRTVMAWQCPR